MTRLLLLVLTGALLTGCSSSCDELAGLQAERGERRASQQALQGTASDEEIGAADDRLHAFERRVFELERSCERR